MADQYSYSNKKTKQKKIPRRCSLPPPPASHSPPPRLPAGHLRCWLPPPLRLASPAPTGRASSSRRVLPPAPPTPGGGGLGPRLPACVAGLHPRLAPLASPSEGQKWEATRRSRGDLRISTAGAQLKPETQLILLKLKKGGTVESNGEILRVKELRRAS